MHALSQSSAVKRISAGCLVLAGCLVAIGSDFVHAREIQLRVVDEHGQLVPKFQAMLLDAENGLVSWSDGANGIAILKSSWEPKGIVRIIVRADGYASTLKQFDGAERQKLLEGAGSVTLQHGKEIEVHFNLPEGMTWPTGALPEVYFDSCNRHVWTMFQPSSRKYFPGYDSNMLNAKRNESGNFSFQLPADEQPFRVAVHVPGFLQCFVSGPYTKGDLKDGSLSIDLPKPAELEISFDPGPGDAASWPFKSATFSVCLEIPGSRGIIELLDQPDALQTRTLQLTDLPPGSYRIFVNTESKGNPNPAAKPTDPDPGEFEGAKFPMLHAGQSEKIEFHFVPYDPDIFRGDRTAELKLTTVEGKPAAGRQVKVKFYDPHYLLLPVFEGATSDTGGIELSHLTAISPEGNSQPFAVYVSGYLVGRFGFTGKELKQSFEFRCPAEAGEIAPNIEFQNLADGKTMKLNDLRGKNVLLDFWATWCGPCQPALEKLNQEAAEHAEAWKDKLVVIPISIDDEAKTAKPHFANRGWTHLATYWTGAEGKTGWHAPALKAFVLSAIPTGVLIDRHGKILWLGNPADEEQSKQLEAHIQDALKTAAN